MLLLVATALASSTYPAEVADHLTVPCEPVPCTICHETNSGGAGTVTRDFGLALVDSAVDPLGGGNADSLRAALDAVATAGIDSDGDGVGDTDEIAVGQDPNPGGVAFCDAVLPVYGCIGGGSAAAFLGLGALGTIRRRR